MIGSRGTPLPRNSTPFTRMARCSSSVTPPPEYNVVSDVIDDRRGKAGSLERHRQCAARDQGLDGRRLARRRRLVAGDDFFDGQRTRADDLHTLGELILAGARRHPDDEVAGGEAHALSARGRRCDGEGFLRRTRHE